MKIGGIVLDVNETLFSLAPLEERFAAAGLDRGLVDMWFARVLRDGFALAATEVPASFPDIARHHLRVLLDRQQAGSHDAEIRRILGAFDEVVPHPDVADGLAAAGRAGVAVATLTNGTAAITRRFLERAGLDARIDHVLEARESGVWKPHRRAYRWAAAQLHRPPGELLLVAVHPWDVHGAMQAGMRGAWLDRAGGRYPGHFTDPDLRIDTLAGAVSASAGA